MLGYKETRNAVRQHCKRAQYMGEVQNAPPHKVALDPQTTIIPESDLWRLIIKSKLPEAEKIEEWVMETVLLTVRKERNQYDEKLKEIIVIQ